MEIGGHDCMFPGKFQTKKVLEVVRRFWPQLVIEEDDGDMFLYKNEAAKAIWDKDVPKDEADMIAVYIGHTSFTLTIDTNRKMMPIVDAIRAALKG
jgi:hypothetical protein